MLDHLRKRNFRKRLIPGKAQNLCRFLLAETDTVNSRAVNLTGVGSGIQCKANNCSRHPRESFPENIIRTVIEKHQLENQRCSPHDKKIKTNQRTKGTNF